MKILSAPLIREWDAATIAAQNITPLELMERAATACANWIVQHYSVSTPFVVICGTGNNGGDGLAITRLLLGKGLAAVALLVRHGEQPSAECAANLDALPPDAVQELQPGAFITELPPEIVVIDALFGTGLNRRPDGHLAEFISRLNATGNEIIAIDLPSGMMADGMQDGGAEVVRARTTLTLGQYKRAMLHPESGAFCGTVHVLDIGLDAGFAVHSPGHWYTLGRQVLRSLYKPRMPFSHKGTHGTAFLIGGSYGLIGAIVLAARAAGRAGAGKVRTLIPECGYAIIQSVAPEAMCFTSGERSINEITGWEGQNGIGIGPGLGSDPATAAAFSAFLEKVEAPLVLDADALNLLALHPGLMARVPRHSILTPHPKELERMFGGTDDSFARAELVRERAMALELVIVSKDRYSIVALPDGRCFYNVAGNAGLATGGSGDVLCGVITGLLAQGYSPEEAALLGVYLHAAAGDAALAHGSMESMVAGDIAGGLGAAFRTLQ